MILLATAALLAGAPPPPAPPRVVAPPHGIVAIIRSRVVRVMGRGPAPAPQRYVEKKGPRCVPAVAIAGAAVSSPDDVDFVLRGGDRVRAQLDDDCPALDYYRGFYVSPQADGQICAGRDAIRTRSGGDCGIDRFRKLVPAAP